MKFSQLIEHNMIFFFKNHAENKERGLALDLILFFQKSFL